MNNLYVVQDLVNDTVVDKHIGQSIRHFRLLRHLTQENIADAIGVTFQQVQKYERGITRIGASRLWSIANILEVQVQDLYAGLQNGKTLGKTDQLSLNTKEISLVRDVRRLSPNVSDNIVQMVSNLAKNTEPPLSKHGNIYA